MLNAQLVVKIKAFRQPPATTPVRPHSFLPMKYILSLLLLLVVQISVGQTPTYLGEEWHPRLPSNSSENLNAVAVNGTTNIVAVGDHGTVQVATKLATSGLVLTGTSPFGDWAKATVAPAITSDLLDVIWVDSQSQYVAVGKQGAVLTSTDGLNWVSKVVGVATTQWNAVTATTGNNLVIVGVTSTGAGLVQISGDKGATWTAKTIVGAVGLKGVVSADGSNVVAVGLNKLFISADHGATWTSKPLAATTPTSLAFVSGKAVIIGTKSWQYDPTSQALTAIVPPTTDLVLNTVGTELVGANNRGEVWSSVDAGTSWQSRLIAQHIQFNAATRFKGDYVVVGDGGVIENSSGRSDGDWLQKQVLSPSVTKDLTSVATNGTSSAVAVGKGATVLKSTAYNTWAAATSITPAIGLNVDLNKVIWDGSQYIAVGSLATVLRSNDGATWTSKSISVSAEKLIGIAWNGSTHLAVGVNAAGNGVAWSSTDGDTWVSVALTTQLGSGTIPVPAFVDVAWTGAAFVSAAKGYGLYSTDGKSWTAQALLGVVPARITSDGTITGNQCYKRSGTQWTLYGFPSPLPATTLVDKISPDVLGMTPTGAIYSSSDGGSSWQIHSADQNVALSSAVNFDNHVVAVGAGGLIETYTVNGTDARKWMGLASVTNSVAWNGKSNVTANDARYVAVGWDMSWTGVKDSASSNEGDIIWTPHRQGNTTALFSGVQVIWSGKQFIAVGGGVWTSTDDGITWNLKVNGPGADPSVNTITNTGSKLIAFGYNNSQKTLYEAVSTDQGDTWSGFVPITGKVGTINQPGYQWEMLGAAKADGDYYLAVGWAGHYLVSQTGAPSEWGEGILKLAYAKEDFSTLIWSTDVTRFIIGTTYGGFWNFDGNRFTKGTVWKLDPVSHDWKKTPDGQGSHAIWSVKRATGEFIAVGNSGFIWKSYNGIDWREYEPYEPGGSKTPNYLYDVVFQELGRVVGGVTDTPVIAVGGLGTFISSDGADVPPQQTITFTPNQATFAENGGTATFTVTVSKLQFPGPLTVPIDISPVVPRYKTNVASLTFTKDQLVKTFTITGIDSAPVQSDRLLSVGPAKTAPGDLKAIFDVYDAKNSTLPQNGLIMLVDKIHPTHDLSFPVEVTEMTEGTTATIQVNLTSANPTNDITVPLTYQNIGVASNYILPTGNKIVIPHGATTASFNITAKNNSIIDADRTFFVILGQPLVNGSLSNEAFTDGQSVIAHTIKVKDNDTKPTLVSDVQPAVQLVAVGSYVTISAQVAAGLLDGVTGSYTAQWLRNGVAIPGMPAKTYTTDQTIPLIFPSVTLANAGGYSLRVTTATRGGFTSGVAQLAVVDQAPTTVAFTKPGSSLTLSTAGKVAGSGFRYQWKQGGNSLAGGTNSTLLRTNVADNDTYVCEVSLGSQTLNSGDFVVRKVSAVPVVTSTSISAEVGADVNFIPATTQAATSWTISGLPAGLTANSVSGKISGSPVNTGTYLVSVVARNAVGAGPLAKLSLVVGSLPSGFAGRFVGLVAADATVNRNRGGSVDLTVTSTGAVSGKLFDVPPTGVNDLGHFTSFVGNLSGVPGNVRTLSVSFWTGTDTKVIALSKLDATLRSMTGTVTLGSNIAALKGWQQTLPTTSKSGYYTASLAPADTNIGYGYTTFTIAADGTVTGAVRTLDNHQLQTFSTCFGPGGQIDIFGLLSYPSTTYGSILSELTVAEASGLPAPANNTVTGTVQWTNPSQNLLYLASLTADGGLYVAPGTGEIVMNLPLPATTGNVTATFAGADLTSTMTNPPNVAFSVSPIAVVTPPASNPATTSLLIDPLTGVFSGEFNDYAGSSPTPATYFGVLVRPGGTDAMVGRGAFNTTAGTGSVTLQKAPSP